MFYSLVQTIVCVLLIQAGIYALHLNGPSGNSNGAGMSSAGGVSGGVMNMPMSLGGSDAARLNNAATTNQMRNILSENQHAQHLHAGGGGGSSSSNGGGASPSSYGLSHAHSKSTVSQLENEGRLTQELADRAQLDRERLMLLGLVKQTSDTGHHGRPIITGRIQMSPVDEVDNDYQAIMLQRGPLYGSVVQQPATVEDNDYVDKDQRDYAGARLRNGAYGRTEKYEYGRIVEPADREGYERERVESKHMDQMNDMIEGQRDVEDILTDLDSYKYVAEMPPSDKSDLWSEESVDYGIAVRPPILNDGLPLLLNLFRTQEELERAPPHILQEMFEKEQNRRDMTAHHQQPHYRALQVQQPQQPQQQYSFSGGIKHRNVGGYGIGSGGAGYNNQLQPKWQRKRSQQQQLQHQQQNLQQMQRNIFRQQRQKQQQQPKQFHHFGSPQQSHSKLSLANSEATATKHILPKVSANSNNNNNKNNNNINKLSSDLNANAFPLHSSSKSMVSTDGMPMKVIPLRQQQQQQNDLQQERTQQQSGKQNADENTSTVSAMSKAAAKLKAQQQQQQYKTHQTSLSERQESFLHPNRKRSSSTGAAGGVGAGSIATNNGYSSMASQMMLRTARGQRQYDVPQIECPTAMDGMERFACPTPDLQGRYRCIDDHVLCDGFIDCPEGEDEDRKSCMFHKTDKAHIDVLADALLRWARGR